MSDKSHPPLSAEQGVDVAAESEAARNTNQLMDQVKSLIAHELRWPDLDELLALTIQSVMGRGSDPKRYLDWIREKDESLPHFIARILVTRLSVNHQVERGGDPTWGMQDSGITIFPSSADDELVPAT